MGTTARRVSAGRLDRAIRVYNPTHPSVTTVCKEEKRTHATSTNPFEKQRAGGAIETRRHAEEKSLPWQGQEDAQEKAHLSGLYGLWSIDDDDDRVQAEEIGAPQVDIKPAPPLSLEE